MEGHMREHRGNHMREHGPLCTSVPFVMFDVDGWVVVWCGVVWCGVFCCVVLCCVVLCLVFEEDEETDG